MSFKSSFVALEDDGGSLLEFGMIQILALYLDFESAKKIDVL